MFLCRLVQTHQRNVPQRRQYRHLFLLAPSSRRRLPYLHDELVSAGDQREAVGVVEGFGNVLPEGVAGAAWRYTPAAAIVRIRPQQVAHGTLEKISVLR